MAKTKLKPGIHLYELEPKEIHGYTVYPDGRVFNNKGILIKMGKTKRGYCQVHFNNKENKKTYYLHRVIAMLFIPNPDKLPEVNHIDGDKSNNHYSNLEWVTRSENIRHAYATGLNPTTWKGKTGVLHNKSKRINQLDLGGIIIRTFGSAEEAMKITGIKGIRNVTTGRRETAGGFKWEYA
jgi:hypothetical protein